MFVIAYKLIILLAAAYLFGLLVAWLFSLFNTGDGGDDFGRDDPVPPKPPEPGKTLKQNSKKRLVEVDESYYLEEFDLNKKR